MIRESLEYWMTCLGSLGTNEEQLQILLDILTEAEGNYGMRINIDKSKLVRVSSKDNGRRKTIL